MLIKNNNNKTKSQAESYSLFVDSSDVLDVQHMLEGAAVCQLRVCVCGRLVYRTRLTSCLEVEEAGSHQCQEEIEGSRGHKRRSWYFALDLQN